MKHIRFITFVLILGTLFLSACGAAAATPTAAPEIVTSAKVEAMPVSFVGIVDSIAGDQWVISGTTVTVDASIVRDGPFNVGDQVKVEGQVNADGSLTVSRLEAPTPQATATQPPVLADNLNEAISNSNTNDANVNDDASNDGNTNDDNGGNTNDDTSNDSNTNDDNGGGNTNDDSSNDDNGGNSNDDSSNDDNGGNSNDDHSGGNDDSGGGDNGGNSNDD